MVIVFGPGTSRPYEFTFAPAPTVVGSPSVRPPATPLDPTRGLGFTVIEDRARPSTAHVLRSFGMTLGGIRALQAPARPPFTLLSCSATCISRGAYLTGGFFGSGGLAVSYKFYVEEFQADGTFVRALPGPATTVVRQSHWYLSGSDFWEPRATAAHAVTADRIAINPDFTYRIWLDVEGSVAADGGGGVTNGFARILEFSTGIPSVTAFLA